MSSLFIKSINIRDKGQCKHKGEKDKLELQDKRMHDSVTVNDMHW